jgi:reactive intermediate/imine deaminase
MKIELVKDPAAPRPLGNYSHAAVWGDLVIVSGMASRDPETGAIPGLEKDAGGRKVSYDIRLETKGTLENIARVLEAAGSDLEHVLEVNTYLLDMKDFGAYNEAYAAFFSTHKPARTTVAVAGLPGDIAIEMRVVAVKRKE